MENTLGMYFLRPHQLYRITENGYHVIEIDEDEGEDYHYDDSNIAEVDYDYQDKYCVFIKILYINGDVLISDEDLGIFYDVYSDDFQPKEWIVDRNGTTHSIPYFRDFINEEGGHNG